MEEEKLLNRAEAMELLQVGPVTFWRYLRDKKFPYYQAGRRLLFKRSEILDAIRVSNK